jgi:hypothetical protein
MYGAIVLLALCGVSDFELEALVRTESRAGVVPSDNPANSVGVVDMEVAPSGEAAYISGAEQAAIRYRPRVLYRTPNGVDRPLLLNELEAIHRLRLSPDLTWTVSAYGAAGEVSYGRLLDAQSVTSGTGPTAATPLPAQLIVRSLAGVLVSTWNQRFDARNAIDITAQAQYTRAESDVTQLPTQISASVGALYGYAITRVDGLELGLTAGVVRFSGINSYYNTPTSSVGATIASFPTVEARLGYRHRFSPRLRLSAHLGYDALLQDAAHSSPLADVNVEGDIVRQANTRLSTSWTLGVQGYANPALAFYGPRAALLGMIDFSFMRTFAARLNLAIYTPLSHPPPTMNPVLDFYAFTQTVFSARTPLIWHIDQGVDVEVGMRTLFRASSAGQKSLDIAQLELMGYASLVVAFGRGVDRPQNPVVTRP